MDKSRGLQWYFQPEATFIIKFLCLYFSVIKTGLNINSNQSVIVRKKFVVKSLGFEFNIITVLNMTNWSILCRADAPRSIERLDLAFEQGFVIL